jgi:hypothetical protein
MRRALGIGWMAAWLLAPGVSARGQVPPVSPVAPAQPPAGQPPSPQAPGAAPAPPPATVPQAIDFPSGAGMIFAAVKPDKTAEFESLLAMFAEALAGRSDAAATSRLGGWRVYKAAEPVPGGPGVLYVVVVDPASGDYSWQSVLETIYAAFPDRQQEVFEKATSVHAGPMSKLTLTRVAASPATPPEPAPKPE